mgnify:CR=1 FL=1
MAHPDALKCLADAGFKVGDLVQYSSDKESTGGVIFQIVQDIEPTPPACVRRKATVKKRIYNPSTNNYDFHEVEVTQYGAWDADGKKIMASAVDGFIRIRPIFEFFATPKGKNPKGKGDTLIIQYHELKHNRIKHVDLVLLGTKYVELGNIMRDIVRRGGMEDSSDANVSEG